MKKIFCFVLIALSLSFCLVGCGEKDESPEWTKTEVYGEYTTDNIKTFKDEDFNAIQRKLIILTFEVKTVTSSAETTFVILNSTINFDETGSAGNVGIKVYTKITYYDNTIKEGDVIKVKGIVYDTGFFSNYRITLSPCVIL